MIGRNKFYSKFFFVFLTVMVLLFSVACGVPKTTLETTEISTESNVYSSDTFQIPEPTTISFELERLRKLDFGKDSLNNRLVLEQLFTSPIGPDEWNYNDFHEMAYWKCTSCAKEKILDENNSSSDEPIFVELPYDYNYTELIGQLDFNGKNGRAYRLLSFSTAMEYEHTGRFVPGMLSLALLEEQASWKINQFRLVVNYQGSFQRASGIDSLFFLSNGTPYFVGSGGVANGVSGEDYWPVYENLYVYNGQTLNEALVIGSAKCWINGDEDLGSKWSSQMIENRVVNGQEQLTFLTIGRLDKSRMWGLPYGLTEAVYNELPKVCQFEITNTFSLVNGEWKKVGTVLESWTNQSDKRTTFTIE